MPSMYDDDDDDKPALPGFSCVPKSRRTLKSSASPTFPATYAVLFCSHLSSPPMKARLGRLTPTPFTVVDDAIRYDYNITGGKSGIVR